VEGGERSDWASIHGSREARPWRISEQGAVWIEAGTRDAQELQGDSTESSPSKGSKGSWGVRQEYFTGKRRTSPSPTVLATASSTVCFLVSYSITRVYIYTPFESILLLQERITNKLPNGSTSCRSTWYWISAPDCSFEPERLHPAPPHP
jgi:hypothetical protein